MRIIISILFSFFIYDNRNVKKKKKKEIKAVAKLHKEQKKACFVVYLSTNTGEQRGISAQKGHVGWEIWVRQW